MRSGPAVLTEQADAMRCATAVLSGCSTVISALFADDPKTSSMHCIKPLALSCTVSASQAPKPQPLACKCRLQPTLLCATEQRLEYEAALCCDLRRGVPESFAAAARGSTPATAAAARVPAGTAPTPAKPRCAARTRHGTAGPCDTTVAMRGDSLIVDRGGVWGSRFATKQKAVQSTVKGHRGLQDRDNTLRAAQRAHGIVGCEPHLLLLLPRQCFLLHVRQQRVVDVAAAYPLAPCSDDHHVNLNADASGAHVVHD